jgi:molybdenum ABC transporter molybdate-binding protein
MVDIEAAHKVKHVDGNFANNFGFSGTLAKQVDQGAPVDVFLSAAARLMDDLEAKGLIVAGTRNNLLRNSLVLITPLDSKLHVHVTQSHTLLASGLPNTKPLTSASPCTGFVFSVVVSPPVSLSESALT